MSAICGVVDLSDGNGKGDFDLLRHMWCAMAPQGRACAYLHNGFSICGDRLQGSFCSLPSASAQKSGENCTLVLDSAPPFPNYARDILNRYLHDGAEALCELKEMASFALIDEGSRFILLSSAKTPFFCTKDEHSNKIFFATEERAIYSLFELSVGIHTPAVRLSPYGIAMHCDIRGKSQEKNTTADRSQQ